MAMRLSAVRSTLVASGADALRSMGMYEAYRERLPAPWRASLPMTVAGSWLPIDAMMAHYAACDALTLPAERLHEIGREVGQTMNELWVTLFRSVAGGVGATPWSALDQYGRFWSRMFIGGSVSLARVGPKEALLFVREFPIGRFAYLRGTFSGAHERLLGLFCSKVYARVLRTSLADDGFDMRLAWV
jgi:hypothetical protein